MTSTTLAPGKSMSDCRKLRLVFPSPTVCPLVSGLVPDCVASLSLQGTQLMLGKLGAWAGAENNAQPMIAVGILR